MVRRAFLRWAGAAAVAASVTFPGFGLKAQEKLQEPLEPKEKVQKVVLSPVLEELERWNLSRWENGGMSITAEEDGAVVSGIPVYSETTGRLLGYAPTKKLRGSGFRLKSRREILEAFGGIQEES